VIKRLRTTQLPTRTAAGVEMASYQGISPPPVPLPDPSISASRLGAEPVVESFDRSERRSQLRTDKQPHLRRSSEPPLSNPAHGSNPDPPLRPSEPKLGIPGTNPGMPAKSTHGRGTGRSSGESSIPPVNAPGLAAPGLAAPNQQLVGTTLGVPPPPKVKTRTDMVAQPPAKSNRIWLLIGALLAICAGVALALALV
jgi:hypothetical protein